MSFPRLFAVVARRWWVIVLVVAVAAGASVVYSAQQQPRYEATTIVFASPSPLLTEPKEQLNELNLLSYGSVLQTLADIAGSSGNRHRLASMTDVDTRISQSCSVSARRQPSTTELYLWVDCPTRPAALALADRLPAELQDVAAEQSHGIVRLSLLGDGPTSRRIQPNPERNVVVGGFAGLLVGFVLAALLTPAGRRPRSSDIAEDGVLGGASTGRSTTAAPMPAHPTLSDAAAPGQPETTETAEPPETEPIEPTEPTETPDASHPEELRPG
jgi:capsular polysaccharide biosynthesis protein